MPKEIERKFKVKCPPWTEKDPFILVTQGYLNLDAGRTVRVRIEKYPGPTVYPDNSNCTITIKGEPENITRPEYEYPIPYIDANEMLSNGMCIAKLKKRRYRIKVGEHTWDVDEFLGNNSGLVLAEIELKSETEEWVRPEWIGEEVTHDPDYYNSRLVVVPQTE